MLGGKRANSEVLNIIDNKPTRQTDTLGTDFYFASKQNLETKTGSPWIHMCDVSDSF